MTVTALLISHDGGRWLPAVLDGLEAQTRLPDRLAAVDTGSTDDSTDLLTARLGDDAVLRERSNTGFGAAVMAGLERLPRERASGDAGEDPEWVWILHDDSAPAPTALESLLTAAAANPTAAVLGPKLREWPSLRRLLEVGVTISGAGRRETGLERGEYDQGQHDRQRDVLAVNSAGMLVRRDVLEQLGGFDPRLPLLGTDLDFGWRAARAGHRTIYVPDAVVFHAEAAHRGLRRTPLVGTSVRRAERRAALYTLMVNCALVALPFQAVRLVVGSLLRVLGLLLVRAPLEAFDELAAIAGVVARPDRIAAGRAARRRTARVSARSVRPLLAPFWMPFRHGLDFVTDVTTALTAHASESATRRGRRVEATETGPIPIEAQNLPDDDGLMLRLLTSPTVAVFGGLTILTLVASRGVLGSGMLSGGALLPAPDTALAWWRLHLESWHDVGVGSSLPAGPYLMPLAVAATLLLGKAWLVVDLLLLAAVPLSAWGGYRFLLRITDSRWPALWGGVAYGLVPVLTGAVNQGRIGTAAAAVLLPWLATSASYLALRYGPDRRWRAAWRTALWLTLLTAFAPVAWPIALVLALGVLAARWSGGGDGRGAASWGPLLAPLAAVPVLLAPWVLPLVTDAAALTRWLGEAGLPAPELLGEVGAWDVVLGRPAELGAAPAWISAGIAIAAVVSLLRADTRSRVLPAWGVLLAALAAATLLSRLSVEGTGSPEPEPLWAGFPLLLVQAAAITAVAVAGTGIGSLLSGSSFGWRQPVGLVALAAAVLTPVAGLGWWVVAGTGGPLDRSPAVTVPAYMADATGRDPDQGVLVVRGNRDDALEYVVLRGDGRRLGDETVASTAAEQQSLTLAISDLAADPQQEAVARVREHGVAFIYLAPPADIDLAGDLDSVGGLTPASAVKPGARAWQMTAPATVAALPEPGTGIHPMLVGLQALAVVVVVVLAVPSRRVEAVR